MTYPSRRERAKPPLYEASRCIYGTIKAETPTLLELCSYTGRVGNACEKKAKMNCPYLFDNVIYWITSIGIIMARAMPYKRYPAQFEKKIIESILEEKLSYRETAQRFNVYEYHRIQDWKHIYMAEARKALQWNSKAMGSKGSAKQLPGEVEEDLLTEVQRLRGENKYLKALRALVLERTRRQGKALAAQELRQGHPLRLLPEIAQLSRVTFYYHMKRMQNTDKYISFSPSGFAQRLFGQLYHFRTGGKYGDGMLARGFETIPNGTGTLSTQVRHGVSSTNSARICSGERGFGKACAGRETTCAMRRQRTSSDCSS